MRPSASAVAVALVNFAGGGARTVHSLAVASYLQAVPGYSDEGVLPPVMNTELVASGACAALNTAQSKGLVARTSNVLVVSLKTNALAMLRATMRPSPSRSATSTP